MKRFFLSRKVYAVDTTLDKSTNAKFDENFSLRREDEFVEIHFRLSLNHYGNRSDYSHK